MAKISVSLDDDLAAALKSCAGKDVSTFVARAVRRQLAREQLGAYLEELDEELGPPSAEELAEAAASFDRIERTGAKVPRRRPKRPRSNPVPRT